ncbi:hypothetical protein HPB47_022892 [Ixodes persulcatus]|uniref:Uncharacterized protein n=1 Tax=Ixodes persulcatus TaxID=34615 RepID=A0AC60Q9L2_IXOPE|nr:hypothetical protein HPB47_022892 [Ixodes persulcatus]
MTRALRFSGGDADSPPSDSAEIVSSGACTTSTLSRVPSLSLFSSSRSALFSAKACFSKALISASSFAWPVSANALPPLFSIYADDITLWVTGGSDGFIQDTLQEAIRAEERYVEPRGLACSPHKSELLLLKPVRTRQLPSDIELYAQGNRIPTVRSIRVLGLRIQADGKNSETIASLKATAYQITRLISRIAGRNYGMKEKNLVRLVRAFVVSRLAYVLPFLRLGLTDTNKLNCLIRKSYKRALGIPDTTSNEKLAALGLHNTVEEIIEAQRVSQLERLTKSATGRHILASLGIRYERQTGEKADVPRRVREALVIPNIPKHMHPTHHAERRAARVKELQKRLSIAEGVLYTDAARAGGGAMVATVVNQQGDVVSSCSIETSEPEVAKEVAIALAIQVRGARIVVSDSQQAIRQFAKGRISTAALKVLGDPEKTSTRIQLIWTPAHSSLPGNEKAHGAARELAHRAGEPLDPSLAFFPGGDRLVTFRDILDHYTGERLRYPPAHPSLDKRTSVAWRRLQTGSFPSPSLLNKWYPDKYKPNCKLCGGHANLRHMVWECSRIDRKSHPLLEKIDNQESWETLLLCSDPSVQNQLVQLAEDAAKT